MSPNLAGVEIAVLGGDAREIVLLGALVKSGARVKVFGLPGQASVVFCQTPAEAVAGVRAVILPVPGVTDENGRLYGAFLTGSFFINEALVNKFPPGAPVLVGTARPYLRQLMKKKGIRLIELLEMDDMAILNSIPTAEGAVQLAMEKLPITIHGCSALVLGYGRTGITLARVLRALGAVTTVAARNPAQLARAYEAGHIPVPMSELADAAREADVVFNTVPFPVLTTDVLCRVKSSALIIDLASAPGGTDFAAASGLGLSAVLAPGLPGKVAPQTAGEILARVVTDVLVRELGLVSFLP